MTTAATPAGPLRFLDGVAHIRVSGDETEGRLAIVEMLGPRGHMPPPHIHHAEDEVFVVLAGEITVFLADEAVRLTAGQTALAPRGGAHTFRVETETARWLAVVTPAGFERFVVALGEPTDDFDLPADAVMPELDVLERTCADFGIELLGPPGALPS